jgi:hypothetical protein
VYQYNGSCDGETQVLDVEQYITVNSNNTLTFWACKSAPDGTTQLTYSIYLHGVAGYESSISNITCTISPIQPTTFPVTYQSVQLGIFNVNDSIGINTTTFSGFIDRAISGLGDIMWESQDWESNLVAESVFTFGVKDFGQELYVQNEQYLQLFEAMIQGM